MRLALFLLPVLFLVNTNFAWAKNPHHRLNTARWSAIAKTEIGKKYSDLYLGSYLLMDSSLKSETEIREVEGKKTIMLHADLASSDFYYLSWILFQGFVKAVLVQEGADLTSDESEIFIWSESMRYLDELEEEVGVVVSVYMDYAHHPSFNYARTRLLSITQFHRLWREDVWSFEQEVLRRKRKLEARP